MRAVLIQPDQLSRRTALLRNNPPNDTLVILVEDTAEFTRVPFHKQRLALILSAMRHFAAELRDAGYAVAHFPLCEDPAQALRSVVEQHQVSKIALMQSASFGLDETWATHVRKAGAKSEITSNDMFISERLGRPLVLPPNKAVRMEAFYRKMRRATGILMEDDEPLGGQWNYDRENRKPPSASLVVPETPAFQPDEITREVLTQIETHFPNHFGSAANFQWPVTCLQAESLLESFLEDRLAYFGPYQDAMVDAEDTLFHSLLSASLNIGLLDSEDLCRKAEALHQDSAAPLNSVEGFIRQVLGWREFVFQFYRANMPGYEDLNYLKASQALPPFYWTGDTRMRCLSESIRPVIERGLSHHIQRLMVTGNFGLVAGVSPQELNRWYWLAFVDAWHWVVTPNVIGMAAFADGGLMASKPYAASANYIKKMSDYCGKCPYNPKKTVGEDACPFNALYWDFLHRNRKLLSRNPRMALSYGNLDRKSKEELHSILNAAESTRNRLRDGLDL